MIFYPYLWKQCVTPPKRNNVIHRTLAYILALWIQCPSHPIPHPMSCTDWASCCSYSLITFVLFSKLSEHMIPKWSLCLIANLGNATTSGKTLANLENHQTPWGYGSHQQLWYNSKPIPITFHQPLKPLYVPSFPPRKLTPTPSFGQSQPNWKLSFPFWAH